MMSSRLSPSTSLLRVVCFIVCYSLVVPFFAFPKPGAVIAGAVSYAERIKVNIPRKAARIAQKSRWRDNELLVRFRQNLSTTEIDALILANRAQRTGRLRGQSGVERLRLAAGLDPEAVAGALRSSQMVELAEPNYLITADQITPDDPRLSEQWALRNDGTAGGHFGSDINAVQGWELTTGSRRTVIAVLDSGIDFTHPDLLNNKWDNSLEKANSLDDDGNSLTDDLHGWDFVNNTGEIRDEQGHGTAVAGIIAAQGNNATGIAGVMWRASLMSLRVLDSTGTGDIAGAVEAIDYAVTNGAQVINCSWGTDDASMALLEVLNWASRRGVMVVTSAGNNSRDIEMTPRYPASYDLDNLMTVASTNSSDLPATWSNWGARHVTIAAPGTDILTTKVGGNYQTVSGSSASAPLVTGVAGLIKTLRPWLNAERTRAIIIRGARPVPSLSGKVFSGGVVNAAGVLNALNTLPPDEGRDSSNGNNGGRHDKTPPVRHTRGGRDNGGNRDGNEFTVTPLPVTTGAPGIGLPNLDELRRKQPTTPKARPPIPSDRCSHRNPRCQDAQAIKGAASATPLPPSRMLAWNFEMPDVGSLLKDVTGQVSDSSRPLAIFSSAPVALSPMPPPSPTTEDVVWINTVNVSVSGNSLTKTASTAWNAGAVSTRYLTSGDGYVEFVASETNTIRAIGLSNADTNQNYNDISFAIYAHSSGTVYIYEGGVSRGTFGTFAIGNKLRVAIEGGFVNYYKDSTLLYTSNLSPSYPLLVDASLYTAGATISDAIISGTLQGSLPYEDGIWTNVVGAAPSGNSLTKTTTTAWNAGAVSAQSIAYGDGYVEFTPTQTNTIRAIGLSNGDTNQNYTDISFAFYLYSNSIIHIYEGGVNRGTFGAYAANDRLRVAVEGGVINYYKNGALLYTSGVTPSYPLLVDASLYTAGATISDVVISREPDPSGNNYSTARLDPINRTGQPGVDLLSRNINWSLPLLGLKGRSGLDLGLSLSYNSLVWTKSQDGKSIKFDADQGFPGPGFRLGFPVIQSPYYDWQTGAYEYLLITPSGGRMELRQTATPNVYEAVDSSYLQLTDNGNDTLLLKDTSGTRLSYSLSNGEYHCTEIKDRNGNIISVAYNPNGSLKDITDTLERTITFNYDANQNLISITQAWGGVTHQWATFGWSNLTVQTSFTNLTVVGPPNGTVIPVLWQVGFSDGTRYNFEYNSYGQAATIRHYADDDHQLSYTSYILPASTSDCPRPTQRKDWAENWNGLNGVPAETITNYSFNPGVSGQVTAPDGTIYKEFFSSTSDWEDGLTTSTEVWSGGVKKKWTTTAWTQDDTDLDYRKNPRPTEVNVEDQAGNLRKTTISYHPTTSFSLPSDIYEYAANGTTVLRRTHTDYNLTATYTNRRIIGLPSMQTVYEGTTTIVSKVEYQYDEGGAFFVNQGTPTSHDSTNYGAAFIAGRGNLTSIRRWDAAYPTDSTKVVESNMGYNTAGSVILARDALARQTNIEYTDSFSDTTKNSLNTFAYPTKVTPPTATGETAANFASTSQYNYDFGAVTRAQGPLPAGQTQGAIQTMEYDAAGRISRVNNLVNNAYRRWVYDSYGAIISYTTIQSGLPETFNVTYLDGAGRLSAQGGDLPNSVGLYRGQYTRYDQMGRASQMSSTGEMNGSWIPAGDDAVGWLWTQQTYDWKGSPLVTTNPDGTTKDVTYGGCGCAGGEVVTVRDEVGRRQRLTADILGRPSKTEVLNTNQSVYSTVTHNYNALDQVTSSVQQVGTNGAMQTTTLTYDGYGRLKTRQTPSQTVATQYAYHADDTLWKATDGRGVVTTLSYNYRRQATNLSYSTPPGITATPAVALSYDAAGNRTMMTDGSGSVSYQYDRLSRLLSETRQFTGLAGSYTLTYAYNLANGLTSVTDPTGAQVSYAYDQTGRVTDVTGTAFAGVTQYASNVRYRAWGALKSASFGDNRSLSASYNSRLLPTEFSISNLISKHYEYNADGRLRFSQDEMTANSKFDRSYTYDHVGRVTAAFSGPLARGEADTDERPYKLSYTYDAMNHLTARSGRVWSSPHEANTGSGVYVNDRNTSWQYDADGRLKDSGETQYTYDAAGRAVHVVSGEGDVTQTPSYDGDGRRTKMHTVQVIHYEGETTETETQYFVTSSVLGGVVTELDDSGQKTRTFVYQGGEILAWQQKDGTTETVAWEHRDFSHASVRGAVTAELEPMGSNAGTFSFVPPPAPQKWPQEYRTYPGFSAFDLLFSECLVDGISMPCGMVSGENSAQCEDNDCGPRARRVTNPDGETRSFLTTPFMAFVNGVSGVFMPEWAEMGTPQEQADVILALSRGGNPTGIDSPRGQGQGRFSHNFLPQNPATPMLGQCNLVTPDFDDLVGHPALGLLSGPFDDDPRAFYNSLSTYNQAVLLNTATALADAGVNLGNANFIGFYRSDKPGNAAFGIEVTGVGKGDLGTIGPSRIFGYRSPGAVKIGSVEATFEKGGVVAFDVDLYNPKSNFSEHQREVGYNRRNNTPTHPGDVARQLAARGVNSGVKCQ